LVQPMTELIQSRRAVPTRPFPQLTDREFDILVLVSQGLDNSSIARKLVLSPKTVRNHVSNVFAKLHAPDRPGAIVLPFWTLDAVALAPGGAHPSYAHGYYDRDNDFYVAWDEISRDRDRFQAWIEQHVLGTADVGEYRASLAAQAAPA